MSTGFLLLLAAGFLSAPALPARAAEQAGGRIQPLPRDVKELKARIQRRHRRVLALMAELEDLRSEHPDPSAADAFPERRPAVREELDAAETECAAMTKGFYQQLFRAGAFRGLEVAQAAVEALGSGRRTTTSQLSRAAEVIAAQQWMTDVFADLHDARQLVSRETVDHRRHLQALKEARRIRFLWQTALLGSAVLLLAGLLFWFWPARVRTLPHGRP